MATLLLFLVFVQQLWPTRLLLTLWDLPSTTIMPQLLVFFLLGGNPITLTDSCGFSFISFLLFCGGSLRVFLCCPKNQWIFIIFKFSLLWYDNGNIINIGILQGYVFATFPFPGMDCWTSLRYRLHLPFARFCGGMNLSVSLVLLIILLLLMVIKPFRLFRIYDLLTWDGLGIMLNLIFLKPKRHYFNVYLVLLLLIVIKPFRLFMIYDLLTRDGLGIMLNLIFFKAKTTLSQCLFSHFFINNDIVLLKIMRGLLLLSQSRL